MKLAAVLLLAASTLTAQTARRPMTFADLQAMKRVSDPQISPSGKWVLFSVTEVDLAANSKTNHLWVVPLDGSAKERELTPWRGSVTNGRFSPDGKSVSFTFTDTGDGRTEIYLADWHEKDATLGDPHTLTHVVTDADGAIWSPDSRHLLFTSSVYPECSDKPTWPEEEACDKAREDAANASPVKAQVFDHLLYRHWNAYNGEKRSHILVVSAADGSDIRDLTPRSAVGDAETPTFSLGGPLGYAWAPDSKEIAYSTNLEVGFAKPDSALQPGESTNNDIFTLRLDDPNAKTVKVSTSPGSDDGPQYSPDGKYLAWRSQARNGYESDKFDLVVLNRTSGTLQNVTNGDVFDLASETKQKFDGWVDEFSWMPLNKDCNGLEFAYAKEGETHLAGACIEPLRGIADFGVNDAEYSDMKYVPPSVNGWFVATRMKVDAPAELYCATGHAAKDHCPLTHLNDALLSQLDLPKMESFFFPARNGDQVQGFLIRPPNFDPNKKYPLKFLIHGGPQGAWGDAWSYRWNPELFAANGYVVVMVNPHGSTGYGQKFLEAVSGDWGGLPYDDLMRGLDYAEAHYPFIDKSRECALGASYGGFMANWVLTHTNRFACIVTHDGMYNPQSAFGTTEELWFNEWEFRTRDASGRAKNADSSASLRNDKKKGEGSAADEAALDTGHPAHPWDFYDRSNSDDPFRKFSPMLAIKNAKTPTLVIHGQKDYRLDVSEGLQLFTALQLLHVPSKMLYFPDEGHWVLKPKNSELWYQTVNDWCDRWTHTNAYAGATPVLTKAGTKGGE